MRQRNYITEMPYTTPNGCVYDSGDYRKMLDTAKDLISWTKWQTKIDKMRENGRMVGIGIGTALDSGTNNFGQSRIVNPRSPFSGNSEAANVRLGADGTVTVAVGSVPQGQSHETIAAQVVAHELGISEDQVMVAQGFDTERATHTSHSGTYASQFAVTSLGAIHGAVEKLKGEMKAVASVMLGRPADELMVRTFDGVPGVGTHNGANVVSFVDISNRINTATADLPSELENITLNCRYIYRPPFKVPDIEKKYGNLTLTYAAQVHIAVVEIEPDTFNVKILDYAVVDDCGRVINHTIVRGQVLGAIAHGIGAALMEHLRYDEFGNLLTSTFSDYCPITTLNMPDVKYANLESPSPFTYNGAKGMGEGGGGPLHCLSAAIQDAVWTIGIVVDRSHYTPSELHEAIIERRGARVSVNQSFRN
jgi:2-furoyl-CoA dehydrogenase large subunit